MENLRKSAFTLIEMLLVIAIIAILMGAVMMGINRMTKTAQKARQQELVSNTADALASILQKEGAWPRAIRHEGANNRTDEAFTRALALRGVMSISASISNNKDGTKNVKLGGTDRCGIVLPQAVAVLKNKSAKLTTAVSGYGDVRNCQLYYAVDIDGDGITKTDSANVRASACVWWSGSGKSNGREAITSWRRDQEVSK